MNNCGLSIDDQFPPPEGENHKKGIHKLVQRYPNARRCNSEEGVWKRRLQPTLSNLSDGMARTKYPKEWITPLRWYWEEVGQYVSHNPVSDKGVAWIEMVMELEIASRATSYT